MGYSPSIHSSTQGYAEHSGRTAVAILFFCLPLAAKSAIHFYPTARFGDSILGLVKALQIARTHKLPFVYTPFEYSDELCLADQLQSYTKQFDARFEKQVKLQRESDITRSGNTLFKVTYFTQMDDWYSINEGLFPKQIDPAFLAYIKTLIKPKREVVAPVIPQNMISVALHVRKGGGFDKPLLTEAPEKKKQQRYIDVMFPMKFPPDSFYIEQMQTLSALFDDKPLYVYLFTDDKDPARLVQLYAQRLQKPNITFDYRAVGNAHNTNVIDDFFAMTHFDCLIRGDSSFSKAAQLLGNFKVVIYPQHYRWEDNQLIIDQVRVMTAEGAIPG